MKDPGFVLRKAYEDALKNNVTVNGKPVPVYDRVPNNASPPWIKFGPATMINEQDKDAYNTEVLLTLEVHTIFKTKGGKKQTDLISNQIMQLIIGQQLDGSPDFIFSEQRLQGTDYIEEIVGNGYIYDKIIVINNYIEQI